MIGYGKQSIDESDIAAVIDVLKSDYLTQGPAVERFEAALCEYTGAQYAVAVNSGTAALYTAYAAIGLEKGKRLWTSPITFVATVNAAVMLGAEIDFVDVDPITGNQCNKHLAAKLEVANQTGHLPDVVVPVHLTGRSCEMLEIRRLANRYGFRVIEDASHALGGTYKQDKIGACRYSDAVTLSFHPVKSITTGEGGAVLTNDPGIAEAVKEIRHHGITRNPSKFARQNEPGFHYEQQRMGFNFRMSDIHAALGGSQLRRLDEFVKKRRLLAKMYLDEFSAKSLPIKLPLPDMDSAWHLYSISCYNKEQRDLLFEHCYRNGIGTAVHYAPVYAQPWYTGTYAMPEMRDAEGYTSTTLSLPLHPALNYSDIVKIVDVIAKFN